MIMTSEKAIDIIKSECYVANLLNLDRTVMINSALDFAVKAIEQTMWIPVGERLPEKTGKYLVTVKNGNVYAGVFDEVGGRFQCAATAWRPLPEGYKEVLHD